METMDFDGFPQEFNGFFMAFQCNLFQCYFNGPYLILNRRQWDFNCD